MASASDSHDVSSGLWHWDCIGDSLWQTSLQIEHSYWGGRRSWKLQTSDWGLLDFPHTCVTGSSTASEYSLPLQEL